MWRRMSGIIERRLLVNYRVDPGAIAPLLPDGLEPALVDGSALAGICMLRLARVRPHGYPQAVGRSMDSAAHRIAVRWSDSGGSRHGVYIPERHTTSRLGTMVGGRAFPGVHALADFDVIDDGERLNVSFNAADGTRVQARTRASDEWSSGLLPAFTDMRDFFAHAPVGWSPNGADIEGVAMKASMASARPLALEAVSSTFFDALGDAAAPDSALVLRDVPVEWTAIGHLSATEPLASARR